MASFSKKISFQFKKRSLKKILWASRLWVGSRKEPILGHVQKNYEKRIHDEKGYEVYVVEILF